MFYQHFMIKNTCQCSKKLVQDFLYKKWNVFMKSGQFAIS